MTVVISKEANVVMEFEDCEGNIYNVLGKSVLQIENFMRKIATYYTIVYIDNF